MWQRLLILGAIIAVTVLAYSPMRSASFVYEDSNAVWNHAGVLGHQPIDVGRARWMTALSHRIVFTLLGPSPRATHAVNLALHLMNGIWVYLLASLWLTSPGALLVSGLFLLHPIQTEAVAYAASRSELLSTFFALAALWVGVHDRRLWRSAMMWLLVLAAVCAKESTIVIVPIVALVDVMQGRKLSLWRLSWLLLPAIVMGLSVLRFDFTDRTSAGPFAYVLLQATAVVRYLLLVVVPRGQTIDHDFVIVPMALQILSFVALMLVTVLAVVAWALGDALNSRLSRWRVVAFGVVWAVVALLPRFVVQIPEMLNEHQMYLPFVGLSLAIGATLARWATPDTTLTTAGPDTATTIPVTAYGIPPDVPVLLLDWM